MAREVPATRQPNGPGGLGSAVAGHLQHHETPLDAHGELVSLPNQSRRSDEISNIRRRRGFVDVLNSRAGRYSVQSDAASHPEPRDVEARSENESQGVARGSCVYDSVGIGDVDVVATRDERHVRDVHEWVGEMRAAVGDAQGQRNVSIRPMRVGGIERRPREMAVSGEEFELPVVERSLGDGFLLLDGRVARRACRGGGEKDDCRGEATHGETAYGGRMPIASQRWFTSPRLLVRMPLGLPSSKKASTAVGSLMVQ